LGVAQASQAPLPLLAREFERSFKIDPPRRNRRQLVAFDRIDQPGLDPLPAQPTTGQIDLEILWRSTHGSLRSLGAQLSTGGGTRAALPCTSKGQSGSAAGACPGWSYV